MTIPCKRPDQNADTVLLAVAIASAPLYTEGETVRTEINALLKKLKGLM